MRAALGSPLFLILMAVCPIGQDAWGQDALKVNHKEMIGCRDDFTYYEEFEGRRPEDIIGKYDEYFERKVHKFSEDGVILTDYSKRDAGYKVSAWNLANYTLSLLYRACSDRSQRSKWIERAKKQADYILKTFPDGRLKYSFPNPTYKAPAGWVSGMSQGATAHFMIRLYVLTEDKRYREGALNAAKWLGTPMNDGGVMTSIGPFHSFFEEVASPNIPSSKIFNGHILAVIHLYHFLRVFRKVRVDEEQSLYHRLSEALIRGANATIKWSPQFDLNAQGKFKYALRPPRQLKPTHYAFSIHAMGLIWSEKFFGHSPEENALVKRWTKELDRTDFAVPKEALTDVVEIDIWSKTGRVFRNLKSYLLERMG